jgi:chromosome segregation ATPase
MSKNKMIEKSNEYLFEVKTQNFKIDFENFIDKIKEDLYIDDKNFAEELIKKYKIIIDKYQEKENKLENKIENLNKQIKSADDDINKMQIKNEEETNKINIFSDEIKKLNNKYIKSQDLIFELETIIDKKNKELKELKDIKSKIDSENIKRTDSYMNKLNEANSKLIQEKNDKIKTLEKELENNQIKIEELYNKNKELEFDYIKLDKKFVDIITISQPQCNNISLENEFNIISLKNNLENEIIKNEILENKILELQTKINTQNNSLKTNLYEYQSINELSDKPLKKCCNII